jgi:hypothetical protein
VSFREFGVVACDVVRSELERVIGDRDIPLKIMDYALHSVPKTMPENLNEAVSALRRGGCRKVAMGYGLCSNGTVGLRSPGELVVPRCHDCIAMLLGSPARYMEVFSKNPGVMYLSDGWNRNAGDPLSTALMVYAPKMGEKRALKGMAMEIANYKYVCLINNGVGDLKRLRERTRENCRVFNKEYMELKADLSYFQALLDGPYREDDFLVLEEGEEVSAQRFYTPLSPSKEAKIEVSLGSVGSLRSL